MHPPCDPPRTKLFEIEYQELIREADRERLVDQFPDHGVFAHLASMLGPRLRAILAWCAAAKAVRRDLAAPANDPALGKRALEI